MHIHTHPLNAAGNGLAGAHSAESAAAPRRAKELREAAARLKASSLEVSSDIAWDSQSIAMVSAWSGQQGGQQSGQSHSLPEPQSNTAQSQTERLTAKPSRQVSYWA